MKRQANLFVLLSLVLAGFWPQAGQAAVERIPGVVLAHSPASTGIYLGSPGIVALPGGAYLAKCDEFGPKSTEKIRAVTRVFRSTDRGRSWVETARLEGMYWASLFAHNGAAFLLGTDAANGNVVIRRSTDAGVTWSVPKDARSGLLLADGRYHCAPVPVLLHAGRLWRAMEDVRGPGGWGTSFRAFMMSIPAEADLLDASNWTTSNRLGGDQGWLGGRFGGWLEGNAVAAPDGRTFNILRVDERTAGDTAAVVGVSADGRFVSFSPENGFIEFPGGCKKFTIRFDPVSHLYWSLTNWIPARHRGGNPERTRNTIALIASKDLRAWEIRSALLYHPDVAKHGFQYLDWVIEGNDLLVASRTAWDDDQGGADNQHNANFLTFHRITGFRDLTLLDSAPELLGDFVPPDKPRVLILGDSISIGYTPFVRQVLSGEAVVVRPTRPLGQAENCAGTSAGIQGLERWLELAGGNWDVIHFNFGLHDLKRVNPRDGQSSPNRNR